MHIAKGKLMYEFKAKVWQHSATGGWFFVSVPDQVAIEIRSQIKWQEEGWGRLKARAKTKNTEWETALWFDTKLKTYLLPIKSTVRKKEGILTNDVLLITIWV
jgi:hypothetical protein